MMRPKTPSFDLYNKKKKRCPFVASGINSINYKDVETLSQFITEKGKILPRRITGTSRRYQKKLAKEIKKARNVGLLSFVVEN